MAGGCSSLILGTQPLDPSPLHHSLLRGHWAASVAHQVGMFRPQCCAEEETKVLASQGPRIWQKSQD